MEREESVSLNYVLITAAAIALCCAVGASVGFLFKSISPEFEDGLNGLAAGIMLCAAALGLLLPAIEYSAGRIWLPPLGILCGAGFLYMIGRLSTALAEHTRGQSGDDKGRSRAVAFVAAIAIHHFPEGIAAGVGFGTGDLGDALPVAAGIAFQNIPEAMIIIPPLLGSGVGKRKAVAVSVISGMVEVVGLFLGRFAVALSRAILPFALAMAAGTMLYVIIDDLVPQTHERSSGRLASFAAIAGFCIMLVAKELL